MPKTRLKKPNLMIAPASWLRVVLTSRALWLALLAALLLHGAVLLGGPWWHLPWHLPSQQRPSIMVQLLRPPNPQQVAVAEVDALTSPEASRQVAQPPVPLNPEAQKKTAPMQQPEPVPQPVSTAAPAKGLPIPAVQAAEPGDKPAVSLLHDMQAPDSVQLQYQLVRKGAESSADQLVLRWEKQEDAHYRLLWQQSVGGKSSQMQSVGVLGANGLMPLRYSEAGSAKSEVATHFVQDTQQIVFSNNSPSAALVVGVQDRVSVLMQLGGILAAQYEAQRLSASMEIAVAGSSQMRIWRWQVLGLQPALPAVQKVLGPDANAQWLAVQHDPQLDGGPAWEPTMVVWYDCNGFLPVRIESRYPNGQVLDAQLNSSQIISSN